jgi:single-strand selective monofunctional uracil DNA glycosylase
MAQTGIPFGEVAAAREWLGCEAPVKRPHLEHPARPVQGFACPRSEVSGRRLWSLFRERCVTPEAFFAGHFGDNYCPLVFMEESGRNRTPDKLSRTERDALFRVCDRHLQEVAAILAPDWVIGIGAFATARIREALPGMKSGTLLHPSPASPKANAGWAEEAARQLRALGLPGW